MAKSKSKNIKNSSNDRGRQTRKRLSFYDEIADPDYKWDKKERAGRSRQDRSGSSIKETQNKKQNKYTVENILNKRKPREKKKTKQNLPALTKFYIVTFSFLAICILFTIMMYSCKASVDSQTGEINDHTQDLEKTYGENESVYNYIFNSNIEKALIKEAIPKDIETVSNMESSNNIIVASEKNLSETNMAKLNNEVSSIVEDDGAYLSFCLIDILSRKAIYYNIDKKAPTFSCIKAPFTCSCVSQNPDLLEDYDESLYQAIKFSENYPYESMWAKVGLSYLYNWCSELNIGDSLENIEYPMHFSVRSMTKFWLKMYLEFNTNEKIASYVSYFTHTKNSAIDAALGDTYLVQSKAGWGDGTINYTGYNDCGIVNADKNPYVLCIFSGYNYDCNSLVKLVNILDSCHADMVAN